MMDDLEMENGYELKDFQADIQASERMSHRQSVELDPDQFPILNQAVQHQAV